MFSQGTKHASHSNQSVFDVGQKAQKEDPEAFRADGSPTKHPASRQQRHTTTHSS
jgi:hypothetical protein